MTADDVLFLCPAYRPDSVDQAREYALRCHELARLFHLQPSLLHDSLAEPRQGDWHRYLHRSHINKLFKYKYLWAIRGGYGCINWASALLAADVQQAPALIGYSDLSVWHAVWRIRDWGESYYAMMPGRPWASRAEDSLTRCLAGKSWELNQDSVPEVKCLHPGQARGTCFASCLRVLSSITGTAAQPDLRGCILAIEDIDERPYSVERDMMQLYLAGVLEGVTGLVVGTMPCDGIPDGYQGPDIATLFRRWGELLQIPVIQALPFGHVADPLSLPNGRPSTLAVLAQDWSWAFSSR